MAQLTSTVIYTALPNPTPTPNGLLVSVLVTPRLEVAGLNPISVPLGKFAFGDTPWPKRLVQMPVAVSLNGGAYVTCTLAPPRRDVDKLDASLWEAIFPALMPVTPYRFQDDRGRKLRSFPASAVAKRILDLYKEVAQTSPDNFPKLDPGAAAPSTLDTLTNSLSVVPDVVSEWGFTPGESKMIDEISARPGASDFYHAVRFYTRRPVQADGQGGPSTPPSPPSFDFHKMVAILSDHPTLMRKLGLVFDVIVPKLALDPKILPVEGTMKFRAGWRKSTEDKFPTTRYHYHFGQFAVAPRDWSLTDGAYMRLDLTNRFALHQVDVDGAALKTVDFAVATRARLLDRQQAPIAETSLPALRSGGFTITQEGRAAFVEQQIAQGAALNSSPALAEFYAEDVLRGYRIDVQVENGPWQSLCRRYGTLTVNGKEITIKEYEDEEGYVKAASAASNEILEDNGKPALYLHEAIAGWDGFSLCARRPGKTIVHTGDPERSEEPQHVENTAAAGVKVQAEYRPTKRSLPPLRFGRSYRLRARFVDVAGNGTSFDDKLDGQATPAQIYQRYEPLASPTLVLRRRITEAESVEHMVIRSEPGMTPEEYAHNETGDLHGYGPQNERHILPPKNSQAMAEAHGMFDKAFVSNGDAIYYYNVALREAGTLLDDSVVDILGGKPIDVSAELTLHNPPGMHENQPLEWPAKRGDPLLHGQYVTYSGTEVRVPYLPDPLACGVALYDPTTRVSDIGPQLTKLYYPARKGNWSAELGEWAEKRSLRLILQGTMGERLERGMPGEDDQSVVFRLPQGQKLTLRYSSLIDPNRIDHMAVWHSLDANAKAALKQRITEGRHWMITPYREIVLVHAVQRPVLPPEFKVPPVAMRDPGGTSARFDNLIACHGYSTSHIDVRASWVDWLDVLSEPGPRLTSSDAEAYRVAVNYDDTTVSTTRHSVMNDRAVAHSQAGIRHLKSTQVTGKRTGEHELGDTKHRVVYYRPVGTTRYQEYFPAEIIRDPSNLESEGHEHEVVLKATARPLPPVPLYVVPTFKWETAADGTRTRRGGGIRIYLDRPWFSSGQGERLGIVLAPNPTEWPTSLSPYISQWGRDPIWSSELKEPLKVQLFRGLDEKAQILPNTPSELRILPKGGLRLAERDSSVVVMGVLPAYNQERQLWYCDVEFDTGTGYFPFISLALTRLQPNALSDCELSTVVRAEFAQLAPDRSATVTTSASGIQVKVWGMTGGSAFEVIGDRKQGTPSGKLNTYDPTHAGTPSAGHRVRARLERRQGGAKAGDLAWQMVGAPVDLMGEWKTARSEALWSGTLPLTANDGAEYRVVISEAEMHETDAPGALVNLGGSPLTSRIWGQGQERITYLDIVPLPH